MVVTSDRRPKNEKNNIGQKRISEEPKKLRNGKWQYVQKYEYAPESMLQIKTIFLSQIQLQIYTLWGKFFLQSA